MDKLKITFIAAVAMLLMAGPIKNWTSNEYITYTDLNNNFNHLHASAGHGHGPIITAADISASAGIRPEQTTFGNSISRNSVFNGTFKANPDGGTVYVLVNAVGSLNVTVTKFLGTDGGGNGFSIDGAAQAGALADGGNQIFTVAYQPRGIEVSAFPPVLCLDQSTTVTLNSPFHLAADCFELYSLPSKYYRAPGALEVEVYNNKVQ
jgi:hypothetical protein